MIGIDSAQRALASVRLAKNNIDQRRLFYARAKHEGFYLLLAVPAVMLLILFFVIPLVRMVDASFGGDEFTTRLYERAFTNDFVRRMFRTTFALAGVTTLGCILLGYPVAYYLATRAGRWRTLVLIMVILPFVTSMVASIFSWRVTLGRAGPVNDAWQLLWFVDEPLELMFNRFPVNVAMIHVFLPFMVLPLFAVMRGIPRSMPAVAESLGANPFQSFRRIFLPLSMPGIWAGSVLVFILSAGHFIAPFVVGGIRERGIATALAGATGNFSAALAMLLLAAIVVIYLVFARLVGFGAIYGAGEALMRSSPIEVLKKPPRSVPLSIVVGLVSFFLILPSLIVIPLSVNKSSFIIFPPREYSLKWIKNFFTTSPVSPVDWIQSTITSLEIAFIAVALAVPLGGLVAYGLVRGRFPGKGLLSSFVILPLIVPSTLTALALFYFYSLNLRVLVGTVPGIALPHAVLALPFVVIILAATMCGVDEVHEQAAMSLGAGRITVLRKIVLPQIIPGIVVAAFFAFLVSFYEVVVAIFLKDPYLRTLPINLWNGVTTEFAPMMAAVSTLLLIFTAFIVVALAFFQKRLNRGASE